MPAAKTWLIKHPTSYATTETGQQFISNVVVSDAFNRVLTTFNKYVKGRDYYTAKGNRGEQLTPGTKYTTSKGVKTTIAKNGKTGVAGSSYPISKSHKSSYGY